MAKSKDEIIKLAKGLTHCTCALHECFESELCPQSHSTACCLHCGEASHIETDDNIKVVINNLGHCNDMSAMCFRGIAAHFHDTIVPVQS